MKYLFGSPGRAVRAQPATPGEASRQALFGSITMRRVYARIPCDRGAALAARRFTHLLEVLQHLSPGEAAEAEILTRLVPAGMVEIENRHLRGARSRHPRRRLPFGDLEADACPGPTGCWAALGVCADALPLDSPIRDLLGHLQPHHAVLGARGVLQDEAGLGLDGRLRGPPAAHGLCTGERLVHLRARSVDPDLMLDRGHHSPTTTPPSRPAPRHPS